ncbi:carboxymuconolactone decarboxylase family protein [Escherichia coli O88:H1]|nr:carboxymuconolactone decarboxylase family protein [Escherichia coli O88:H1]EJG7502107.1 carboxymuconolactone decarboxylase family protein [Escherichia coli]MDC3434658.1 carboxymuconolactone decarboxylase family protein [Escherichia coli]
MLKNVGSLGTEIPDPLKVYQTIAESANRQGVLDQKTQELISLAVAVTTRCDGCISIHSQAALKAGASREEIAAALAVAVSLNAGAAVVYSSHVMEAINQ